MLFHKKKEEAPPGIIGASEAKRPLVRVGIGVMYALMILICIFCLFPPAWILLSSFKDVKEFFAIPPTIIPRSFHPEKLGQTWQQLHFMKYYLNTFIMAAGDLVFCLVVNGLCGYVLSRLKPKGHQLVFALILWTMMMPTSTSMVSLFMTFLDFPVLGNLTNSYLPMWIMAAANPFNVLLFKSFFDSIPMSYIEAARIDGCTNLGIFARIIMPLSKPIIMVISIFSFTASWDNFIWPYLVLKNPEMYTVSLKLFTMASSHIPMDMQIVAILFAIIPPSIIFLLFQKHIMAGFTLSGVKG